MGLNKTLTNSILDFEFKKVLNKVWVVCIIVFKTENQRVNAFLFYFIEWVSKWIDSLVCESSKKSKQFSQYKICINFVFVNQLLKSFCFQELRVKNFIAIILLQFFFSILYQNFQNFWTAQQKKFSNWSYYVGLSNIIKSKPFI
jgi:hypothetical protein